MFEVELGSEVNEVKGRAFDASKFNYTGYTSNSKDFILYLIK
jgi:hypothetical protein